LLHKLLHSSSHTLEQAVGAPDDAAKRFGRSAPLDAAATERAGLRAQKDEGVACPPWWLPPFMANHGQAHSGKQLIFFAFALGKTAGFASRPRPAPKTCGSCQLYYDLEMGLKEWGSDFKETSDALYAVLDMNPLWPFDKPVSSGTRWGCSCERDGFRPMWLAANGLCFWFDQQKNQDELLSNDNITEAHRRSCQGAEAGGIIEEKQGAPRSPHTFLPHSCT
jgi:hypothetical protein